ncbi:MAG TPA: VIT family protein [Patescibacteria group bacterium]|nr:VIT family protein [Patescibacteria group bacterium]
MSSDAKAPKQETAEHKSKSTQKLNWLRAAVLGANDGVVSIAGLVVGVAGASASSGVIFMTGVAGVLAGALAMAAGEYVSVSSQRDAEKSLIDSQHSKLHANPDLELQKLTEVYEAKGLRRTTAAKVAIELTDHNAIRAHAEARLGLNPDDLVNPWHAAIASAVAFISGSTIPIVAIMLPPTSLRVPVTFVAVTFALALTGAVGAHAGESSKVKASLRVVIGGVLAMVATFVVGRLFHVSGV